MLGWRKGRKFEPVLRGESYVLIPKTEIWLIINKYKYAHWEVANDSDKCAKVRVRWASMTVLPAALSRVRALKLYLPLFVAFLTGSRI